MGEALPGIRLPERASVEGALRLFGRSDVDDEAVAV
jgi:hypothetical protein